ncbi:MAG TPA: mechanosensitive ion channel family protein [Puia sp.]|nr:mechanosensitive ion channel family protein [Puia sp.]
MDSALRAQLDTELKRTTGDQLRTRALQFQLQRVLSEDSIRKVQQLQRIRALKKSAVGYPVVLHNDTLFLLYTKTGSFSAAERANAVSQRVGKLYNGYTFLPDSLRLLPTESGYDIIYRNDFVIMSVAQLDALWFDTSADSLAASYRATIIREIVQEKKANSLKNWLRRLGWTALVLVILALAILGINRLFRILKRFIRRNRERFAHGFTFRKYQLVTPGKLEQFALQISSVLKVILILLSAYIALLLISGLFTATEKWTGTLLSWILTPARSMLRGFIHFLPNLFTIAVIYFVFRFIIRGIQYLSAEIGKGNLLITGFHPEWAQPTFNIVRFLLYAFMVVLIFPYLPGSASPAFRGVSVFLGVLISLGSSSAINNIVAGLVITYMRPFKVGDRVKIGDVMGDILEKTMLVTRIRTIKNEDVTVPNSTILSASSINFSSNTKPEDSGLILHTTVTIGYDVPWKEMHKALIEAAKRTDWIEKSPEPFVLQTSLDNFYVSYQLNAYTKEPNKQAAIYSQLHQNIQDTCNEAGIEIMSPNYQSMRDGNATTIPPDYLPKDYEAPPFTVRQKADEKK